MSSILLKLDSSTTDQDSQDFTIRFQPSLPLQGEWGLALVRCNLWYSWYNIDSTNNIFTYSHNNGVDWNTITIPDGQYTVEDINDYVHSVMKDNTHYTVVSGEDVFDINLNPNYNNSKVEIELTNNYQVDFTIANSCNSLLGFTAIAVTSTQEGANHADITNGINSLMIHCDLISGSSYENGNSSDVLYSFVPESAPSSSINVEPISRIYLPVTRTIISSIQMRITDQQNNIIDLNGEPVTYLLELKKI